MDYLFAGFALSDHGRSRAQLSARQPLPPLRRDRGQALHELLHAPAHEPRRSGAVLRPAALRDARGVVLAMLAGASRALPPVAALRVLGAPVRRVPRIGRESLAGTTPAPIHAAAHGFGDSVRQTVRRAAEAGQPHGSA